MKLIAYSASEHGGMMGGYSSTSVTYTKDGRCRVETADRPFHSQPIRRVRYYADGLLEKLSQVCERYPVMTWTDLPEHKIVMLDDSKRSESLTFDNGTKILLGSDRQYPPLFRELRGEFDQLIRESQQYGVEIETSEDSPMMMFGFPMKLEDVQAAANRSTESAGWAKFCGSCGAKFTENQRFCPECGAVRQKR